MSQGAVSVAESLGAMVVAGSRAMLVRRRLVSLSVLALAFVGYLVALPLLLVLAAGGDLVRRRPWVLVRCVLYIGFYAAAEVAGVLAAFAVWVASGVWAGASRTRFQRWNVALQTIWATALYRAVERVFRMRTVVEGTDALEPGGPLLLFMRHVSTADTLLPVVTVARPTGVALRYVLKRELLWDPCLDIVGLRLPNCFVRRGSDDSAREIAAVQRLLIGLGPHGGVVLYPEGTRFTPARRARVLEKLAAGSAPGVLARARQLRHVLPPHLGGALGLLAKNPGADVVFCAHTGLEGAGNLTELTAGCLIGATVRVAFWRVPVADVPRGRDAQVAWLYDQWQRIDDWIDAHRAPAAHAGR